MSSDESQIKNEALVECFHKDVSPYIDVIDELRRIGVEQYLSLPNVVVVGDQSSGKSSIIEALSGIQLPRGSGIVTRCPLELQLKPIFSSLKNDFHVQWRAILKYRDQEKSTYDREEVGVMIRNAQNEICGPEKDVRNELITLRIEDPRPNAPELTLIDLPGISRTPVAGQSDDVCDIIRKTVLEYVEPENTVILCMVGANLDFAVNESLQIARKADPEQVRTIGVITKPDLADKHQKKDVMQVLNNIKYPLEKGYVIVKCRSQDELEDKLSLEESRINEMEFFLNDPYYMYADNSRRGIDNLATKITEELVEVIKSSLPDLKDKIDDGIKSAQSRLSQIPETIPAEKHEKYVFLSKSIFNLCGSFKEFLIDGCNGTHTSNGYTYWRKYFQDFFGSIERKRRESMENKFDIRNLQRLIERSRGSEISLFLNNELFKQEVRNYLINYQFDADKLAELMHRKITDELLGITSDKLEHLPEIKRDFNRFVIDDSKACLNHSKEMSQWILKQERIVFVMDTLFSDEYNKQLEIEQLKAQNVPKNSKPIPDEYMQGDSTSNAETLQRILKVYLKIMNKRLADRIPMTIMECLLVDLEGKLNASLMEYPSKIDINEKVKENVQLRAERQKWIDKINKLSEAQDKLSCL